MLEMDLIERKALGVSRCSPFLFTESGYAEGWNCLFSIISDAPTIDPVHASGGCYCRECENNSGGYCYNDDRNPHGIPVTNDDFCSRGKRKEAAE